jgi:hypothetical protein
VAVGAKITISSTACFEILQELVGKHILNVIKFEELKATVMEIILKNKARGPEVTNGRVVEK